MVSTKTNLRKHKLTIFRYYTTQISKKIYSVDHDKLKEYFPLETVLSGMMEIYQRILGLKFTKLEDGEVG